MSSFERRVAAQLAAAAAVVGLALVAAAVLARGGGGAGMPASLTAARTTGDPHAVALHEATSIVAAAPVPPGAKLAGRPPSPQLREPAEEPSAQHVQATRFWSSSRSSAAVITYLDSHPPKGMRSSGSGIASGPGIPEVQSLDFQSDELHTLQYEVVPLRGGSAIRADAQVLWAPARSPLDTVPTSVAGVDVLIVRQRAGREQLPTVRRTVTGAAARRLVALVNGLPRAVPTMYASCPVTVGGERRIDRLVFRGAGPTARLLVDLAGCGSAELTVGRRKPIELSQSFTSAIDDVDRAILGVLGLPAKYRG